MDIIRKYKRLGLTDSALELYEQEIEYIKEYTEAGSQEWRDKTKEALNRLEKNSLVSKIDMRKGTLFERRFSTWSSRHNQASLQDYIDMIDNFNAFRSSNNYFADFTSEQIQELFDYGRQTGLSDTEVISRAEQEYERGLGMSINTNKLYSMLLESLDD